MRQYLTSRCLGCTAVILFSYTVLSVCVLDVSVISNFFSSLLSFQLPNKHRHRVHGLGTLMVNVKHLAELDFDDRGLQRTTSPSTNTSDCFQLFWNLGELATMEDLALLQAKQNRKHVKCNSYITLTSALGRTGNQMFQIASLLGTAYLLDMIPVIDPSFPLARYFKLPNLVEHNFTNFREFGYHRSAKYTPLIRDLNTGNNWTLRGYFQSWKYFEHSQAESAVKQAFRIKDRYMHDARLLLSNHSLHGTTNVCIHVRRGDFQDSVANVRGYVLADLDFIHRAMDFHRKREKHVRFIIISDGMLWCKEHIHGNDVVFSPFYTVAEDMALMTLCDHVVVTSGTFGWWGAWLSGGTTVYYKDYPRPDSWLDKQFYKEDYYPPEWIAL